MDLSVGFPGDDAILSIPPAPYNPMVVALDGRTRVRAPRNWGRTLTLVTVGQSLTANYTGGEKLTGPDNLWQVNLMDGALYVAQDPMLGVDTFIPDPGSNSNFAIRLGRLLLATGRWERVVILPIGVGSTPVQAWMPGGVFNPRIVVAAARLRALGLAPDAVLWQQGTSNAGYTPAGEYASDLLGVIATFRASAVACPILVAQDSWVSGVIDPELRKGQRAVWNTAAGIYPGPDIDLVTERRDTAHMTAAGGQHQAQLWFDALNAVLAPLAASTAQAAASAVPAAAAVSTSSSLLVYVQGASGAPGPAGPAASDLTPVSAVALSGHRAVCTLDDGTIGYASSDQPLIADRYLGVTVSASAAGAAAIIRTAGEIDEPSWNWEPGPVYVGLNGALTQSEPTSGVVIPVGTASGQRLVVAAHPYTRL